MTLMRRVLVALLVAAVLAGSAGSAYGVGSWGTLSGTVSGPDGTPIDGASVTISIANGTGGYDEVGAVVTDPSGSWTYAGRLGRYALEFEAAGFEPSLRYTTVSTRGTYTTDVLLQPAIFAPAGVAGLLGASIVAYSDWTTASANAAALSIAKPAGTVAGDFLLALVTYNGATGPSNYPGWNLLVSTASGTLCGQSVLYRFASTGDPTVYTFTWAKATPVAGTVTRFTGVDPTTPITATAGVGYSANFGETAKPLPATLTASAIVPDRSNTMLVAAFGIRDADPNETFGAISDGMTPRAWVRSTGGNDRPRSTSADQVWTSGNTGDRTVTFSKEKKAWVAHLVALNPIPNRPPVAGTVDITPDPAYTNDTLTATPSGFTDPDGDPLTYHYTWTRNGSPVGSDSATLDLSVLGNGDKGDLIAVSVAATDGSLSSGAATDSLTVSNAAPVAGTVDIAPDPAYTNSLLTALVSGFTDADADSLTYHYAWTNGGAPVGTDSPVLDLSVLGNGDKGDLIAVSVTATDGSLWSGAAIDSLTVSNTAPVAGTVDITPDPAYPTSVLTAAPSGFTDADADLLTYHYAWTKNGSPVGTDSQTLDLGALGGVIAGDVIAVSVTASDGLATSGAATDSVTITAVPGNGRIEGQVTVYGLPRANAFVWIYKQNPDGSWPAISPGWGSPNYSLLTDSLGNYSQEVPYGNYKVRFMGSSMMGSQWWEYISNSTPSAFSLATTLVVDADHLLYTGINGRF